jgi:hypothetical protein
MDKQYTLFEGLKSLERIKLMMGYDMSKTLNENTFLQEQTIAGMPTSSQQQTMGLSKEREDEKKEFLVKNKIFTTPYNGITKNNSIAIPDDSKVSLWNSGDDRQKGLFSNWFKTGWQEYIPKEDYLKKLLPDNTLRSFTTSDGIKYMSFLERTTEKEPYYYRFIGYKDEKGNPYDQEKYVGKIPELMEKSWFRENASIISQIAASIVVGILTGGQSLVFQAIAQLGVDLAFAIPYIQKGDNIGAAISVIMGLIPVAGRLSKFGVKSNISFLSKYGKSLSEITEVDDLIKWYEKLDEPDKLLMTRVFKQTPGELKNMTSKSLIKGFTDAVENKTIELSKIPASQLLWWKQLFVEGGVSLSTGVGLQIANTIYQSKKTEEKISSTQFTQTEKSKEYSKKMEILKTKDPVKYNTTLDSTVNLLGGESQDPRELEW